MIYWFLGIVLIPIFWLAVLSVVSRTQPELGVVDGRLRPCPGTPNCVNSEDQGKPWYIEPLSFKNPTAESWKNITRAIQEMGGKVEIDKNGYIRATFMTSVFRFVDDLELRLDKNNAVIQVRSASRVGRSDMGLNRKRVNELRAKFSQKKFKESGLN
ncbi:MAG: DUF1499 domain-containing protein [Sulfuricaulis sp.]|nr:DUF1499 domain-containing protein [Sulfuricaulis sp.]